jgi:hypothetical protein
MASWWRSRPVALGAALLALVAVVALASRGHAPGGGGGGGRHVDLGAIAQYGALAVLFLAAAGLPFLAWTLWGARDELEALPRRGNWMVKLLGVVTLVILICVAVLVYRSHQGSNAEKAPQPAAAPAPPASDKDPKPQPAGFDWTPLVAVLAVGLVGATLAVALLARGERSRPRSHRALAAAALSEALDESLDDLRSEADSRRAVIAAYARMERALAAAGVPRRSAETALEYLARVLSDLVQASAASVKRLTELFERAQFSLHEIGPQLKDEAIEALVAIRDELRAFST